MKRFLIFLALILVGVAVRFAPMGFFLFLSDNNRALRTFGESVERLPYSGSIRLCIWRENSVIETFSIDGCTEADMASMGFIRLHEMGAVPEQDVRFLKLNQAALPLDTNDLELFSWGRKASRYHGVAAKRTDDGKWIGVIKHQFWPYISGDHRKIRSAK